MKESNFNKICNIAMDDNVDIIEMFNENELNRIASGDNVYVVYAADDMFSHWGKSKGAINHVFVICFSADQKDAVESSLRNQKSMKRVSACKLEPFFRLRHGGTWSVKNANDCPAWNKGIIV